MINNVVDLPNQLATTLVLRIMFATKTSLSRSAAPSRRAIQILWRRVFIVAGLTSNCMPNLQEERNGRKIMNESISEIRRRLSARGRYWRIAAALRLRAPALLCKKCKTDECLSWLSWTGSKFSIIRSYIKPRAWRYMILWKSNPWMNPYLKYGK